MKSLRFIACMAILCSVACKKITPLKPVSSHPSSLETGSISNAENLGNILKGTNVSWKINPLNPGNAPIITYAPNSNTGFVAVMIDNGILNGATPVNAIRFIAANLQTGTSKIIEVKSKATGLTVTQSLGRLTQCTFGTNKKLYVGTEAAPEGGGHLIEYDPNTQTALDLGEPLKLGDRYLGIYMMNVGADGALYGGSFGSNGDAITFRYDYNNAITCDKTSIDADAKYVAYVSGDAKYTYASVGQDKWKVYAIERATGAKKLLIESNNPYERIEIASHTDAPYAKLIATHYKLNGFTASSLGAYNTPPTARKYFVPYELEDVRVPSIVWNGNEKKLYSRFPAAAETTMTIDGVTEDIYPIGAMVPYNNTLFVNSAKTPLLASYDRNYGFKYIGSGLSIHCMAPTTNGGSPSMYCGGYPRGFLMEYKINNTWTLDKQTTTFTPPDVSSSASNPKKLFQFQDADAQGNYGCMYLSSLVVTKDGFMVGGGNNDRLTVSTNRELSFGSYKNGVNRNMYLPEFQNYEFTSMVLSADSMDVYVAASHKYGGKGKIYTYNPATNTVKSSIDISFGTSPGAICLYAKNTIVGSIGNMVYLLDIAANTITWKKTLGPGEAIVSISIAPDHSVFIGHMYLNTFTTRIAKIKLDTTEPNAIKDTVTPVADIKDADEDENTKVGQFVFMPTTEKGQYDLYLAGLKSLYRVNNVITN